MDQPLTATANWSSAKKIFFRFFCIYFIVFAFPFPLESIDWYYTQVHYHDLWNPVVQWMGKHVLQLGEITLIPSQWGDSIFYFVELFTILLIAVMGCLVWTVLDRRRPHYQKLSYWLTVWVRYFLAYTMFLFGFNKVFDAQFPFPDMDILLQSYGESTPRRLAWTFMGYSYSYSFFTGLGEVLGGFLLLFRKTTTLGALLVMAVMSNVVMMNFSFGIMVKVFSAHLMFMAIFLLAKDGNRLINFFILNKPVLAIYLEPPFNIPWKKKAWIIGKVLVILYLLIPQINNGYRAERGVGDKAPKHPLSGIYNVETFVRNNENVVLLQTDTIRWKQLIISGKKGNARAAVKMMNDSLQYYAFRADTVLKNITLISNADTAQKYELDYSFPGNEIMLMQGKCKDDSIKIRMRIFDVNKFPLVNSKFRWTRQH